jgi:hypothetical protein
MVKRASLRGRFLAVKQPCPRETSSRK